MFTRLAGRRRRSKKTQTGTPTHAGPPTDEPGTEGLPAFFCETVDKYGFTLINY